MYEEFYGLREKPFSILPDPDLIYWGPNHRLAFAMLEFGVLNSAGFTVITGDIGSGKTTLIRHLLRKLDAIVKVGLVSNTPHGRDELLQWIMMSLDLPFSEAYPAMLQNSIISCTSRMRKGGAPSSSSMRRRTSRLTYWKNSACYPISTRKSSSFCNSFWSDNHN